MTEVKVILALGHAFITRLSEWMLAFVMATWGLVLLAPEARYDDINWSGFQLVISEDGLGFLMLVGGMFRLGVLSLNGAFRPMYYIRAWLALTSAVMWFAICLGFVASGNFGTWIAVYPYFLIFDTVNMFRAVTDAAEVEKLRIMQEGKKDGE